MKKKVLLLLTITLHSFLSLGQKSPKEDSLRLVEQSVNSEERAKRFLPQYTPLSPNAAGLQKFGTYQVNLATGIPSIPIQLFTVQDGSLSVPITLNYHASGFKLNEMASWVGWGWSLNVGASLNRTVQGLNDDRSGGEYLTNPITLSRDFCKNYTDFYYGRDVVSKQVDSQPDIFSYSILGKSGNFLLGQLNNPVFKIPDSPLKISYSRSSDSISSFDIIDDNGISYNFGVGEVASVIEAASFQNYVSNWQISAIKSPTSNDKISYSYQSGGGQYFTERQWVTSMLFNAVPQSGGFYENTGLMVPTYSTVSTSISQKNIHKISYTNGEVEFVQSEAGERLDLNNSRYLKEINVYAYEENIKKLLKVYQFNYSYFQRNGINKRLKLDNITVKDASNHPQEVYSFEYWSDTISWDEVQDNEKKDYWGYYNGKPNTHLIPVGSYNNIAVYGGAADRSTVGTYMKEGVLKRITFPTQGYTEFDYEPNRYLDGSTELLAGGLRVKSIKSYAGNSYFMKRYEYASNGNIGVGRLTTNWLPVNAKAPKIQHLIHSDFNGTPTSFGSADQAYFTQSGGAVDLNTMDTAPVYYGTVTEYFEEENNPSKNGKTVYEYDFKQDVIVNEVRYTSRNVQPWERGNLIRKTTYDKDNNKLYSLSNTYTTYKSNTLLGGAIVHTPNIRDGYASPEVCVTSFDNRYPDYIYHTQYYQTGINLVTSIQSQTDNVSTTQTNTYNDDLLLSSSTHQYSLSGKTQTESFVYPSDASYQNNSIAQELLFRNMRNIVLENRVEDSNNGINTKIYEEKKVYDVFSGTNARGLSNNLLPKEIWVSPTGGLLERRVIYHQYDDVGNPTEYSVDGIPTALLWGYQKSLLLAQAPNTSLSQLNTALSNAGITAQDYSLSSLSTSQRTMLATLQEALPNSLLTWYVHRPQIGLSHIISPNNVQTTYEYDSFNRLKLIKDNLGNNLSEYAYEYGLPNKITTINYTASNYGNATHQYLDGLGRPIQQVGEKQSPTQKDIILSSQMYDSYGRLSSEIAPFGSTSSMGNYEPNANVLAQSFYGDTSPYTTLTYESSPLNRIRNQMGLGYAWRLANRDIKYFEESAGTDVRNYEVDNLGNIVLNGTFDANSLYKKRTIDERENETIEITDKMGRLVQRQQSSFGEPITTYYLYDGLGRTIAILQPEAYGLNKSLSINTSSWKNGVFFYRYDRRGRLIESHVPNGGWTKLVYDQADRQIFSQDTLQAQLGRWSFKKYDRLGRLLLSGEKAESRDRASLQTEADSQTTLNSESRTTVSPLYYTLTNSYPSISESDIYEVYYYDRYGFSDDPYISENEPLQSLGIKDFGSNPNVKGLQTGIRSLNQSITDVSEWKTKSLYYDQKNRLITINQASSNTLRDDYVIWQKFMVLNYSGNIIKEHNGMGKGKKRYFPDLSLVHRKEYQYDLQQRKTAFYYQIGKNLLEISPIDTLSYYKYDEIGRLKQTKIRPTRLYNYLEDYIYRGSGNIPITPNSEDLAKKAVLLSPNFMWDAKTKAGYYLAYIDPNQEGNGLQTMDYDYHIRGNLLGVNREMRSNQNDLFGYQLDYEKAGYYDGNIGKQIWRLKKNNTIIERQYRYFYDALNRFVGSTYTGEDEKDYSLNYMSYDHNGNIKFLQRSGVGGSSGLVNSFRSLEKATEIPKNFAPPQVNSYNIVDNLEYHYEGNQLKFIIDHIGGDHNGDFVQRGNGLYTYYPNGALKSDENEGITNIIYDTYLKQPKEIQLTGGRWIQYYYTGEGDLIKTVYSTGETWEYYDNVILKNGAVYQVSHDEGRSVPANNGTWQQEFDYRDHLGNTRLTFRDSLAAPINGIYAPAVIIAQTDFDPYGLVLRGAGKVNNYQNRFEFLNREKESTFGLNIIEQEVLIPPMGVLIELTQLPKDKKTLALINMVGIILFAFPTPMESAQIV